MSGRWWGVGVVVAAVAGGIWLGRDQPVVRQLTSSVGLPSAVLPSGDSTPSNGATLAAAGVHKCSSATGPVYLDRPCPAGSRELPTHGGTVSVMSFAKPAPVHDKASGTGTGLIQGFSPEQIEQMREKQIDEAADR